jgi:LPXTG-motif cell wall-anchored protein
VTAPAAPAAPASREALPQTAGNVVLVAAAGAVALAAGLAFWMLRRYRTRTS